MGLILLIDQTLESKSLLSHLSVFSMSRNELFSWEKLYVLS